MTAGPCVGSVHSFDISTGVDGPGTRFVAFLAGCPLRCQYCHSPDTWYRRSGESTSVEDLLTEIRRYERFIKVSGGGVTLSGGEPLQQPGFVREVLAGCKQMGLHTALDTSGFLGDRADDVLLADVDLVLLDIKSGDSATYRKVTRTGSLAATVRFAHRLAMLGKPVWVRFVLVPGLTDDPANVDAVADLVAGVDTVERVEVLPFHRLGTAKYTALGLDFPLAGVDPPGPELLDRVRCQFRDRGLSVY
ncbi:pyruvate formate lyase activating enzyme [Micromonospora phaseoli]|uniref:Pyruvate formate-lyase-activating enzyme n=1 Tax=Micromonospora phaseoli TaxID=1144548 RepID=A0A1H7C197_9ACTN|nr:pyruvate formate-lyase-activating protein [Micromonospora phaseoli]PZV92680.1 pyruvate formate lyase activating enzyme [Micromonospora phaseoli]GIJ76666.1 pyruvate formate-lyase-activating enzyme [Micromonospora phaseoli]SEJ83471.1 pyruvate formate lyase activating enzyme [Micromonospora phaseoli]